MVIVEFASEEKEQLERMIKTYFQDELGQEIGRFEAGYVLDFFSDKMGTQFYNKGLFDAQAILEKRMETITEAIHQLEKLWKSCFEHSGLC